MIFGIICIRMFIITKPKMIVVLNFRNVFYGKRIKQSVDMFDQQNLSSADNKEEKYRMPLFRFYLHQNRMQTYNENAKSNAEN